MARLRLFGGKWSVPTSALNAIPLVPAIVLFAIPASLTGVSLVLHLLFAAFLALGIVLALRRPHPAAGWPERIIPFGPVFYAAPMGFFGLQHFACFDVVKQAVPPWMPGHSLWAYIVGVALIAACLSLITEIQAPLAALLMGIMLFLFVLMIDVPALVQNPFQRFTISGTLRDLCLSGGALAFAGALGVLGSRFSPLLAAIGRWFFAAPMLYYGVVHFLYPHFAPGVPFPKMMPSWLPGPVAWSWATGAVLIVCGFCILAGIRARAAAAWLGIAYVLLVLFIYLPMEAVHPSIAISGELDYVADTLAVGGAALLVARSLAVRESAPAAQPEPHQLTHNLA